jgi:O-antigen/teichoic acid export membrane protein
VAAVGFYNPGYALGSLLALLPKIFGEVLPPLLYQAVDSGNESEARTMLDYSVKGFLLVAIPFCAGCALLGKPLLTILANAEVAQKGSLVAVIVALGTVFYGLELIIANLLFVQMRTAAIININAVAALLNLSLNLVLLYYFRNILVAALTTFFSYLVTFISIYRVAARFWPIDFGLKIIFKSIGASLLMALALYAISAHLGVYSYQAGYLLGEIALGIIIYCLGLFALKTFSSTELVYLKKALSLP